ncbi:uncharacterized protein LOC128232411 [Mya arenaria]|uniref:uncharacterized protein LOC128232411 n=1 Tax=Mya arenaria TaxID=6604 RepID=UPI0022E0F3B3|nr:uncharacterized protein LOC128232411 [Mya arenaria]
MDSTIVICCILAIGAMCEAIRLNQGYGHARPLFLHDHPGARPININPDLCTPEVAPLGCWRVPNEADTMNIEIFKNQTSGTELTLLWILDGIGYYRENILNAYHSQLRWTLHDDDSVTVGFKYREGKEPGAPCRKVELEGNLTRGDHAIIDLDLTFPEPLGHMTPRYWLMSDHPDDYVLLFSCINPAQVQDRVCYGRWYAEVFVTSDPPDHPPMHLIVEELYRKLGLTLDNPGFRFINTGHACPEE